MSHGHHTPVGAPIVLAIVGTISSGFASVIAVRPNVLQLGARSTAARAGPDIPITSLRGVRGGQFRRSAGGEIASGAGKAQLHQLLAVLQSAFDERVAPEILLLTWTTGMSEEAAVWVEAGPHAAQAHIFISLSGASRGSIDDALERAGFQRRVVLTLASASQTVPFVASSDMVATVPESRVRAAVMAGTAGHPTGGDIASFLASLVDSAPAPVTLSSHPAEGVS